MRGDRSGQGCCKIRPDIHARFKAIVDRTRKDVDDIMKSYKAAEGSFTKTGYRQPKYAWRKNRPQQWFIEDPNAIQEAPAEVYVDSEVMAE